MTEITVVVVLIGIIIFQFIAYQMDVRRLEKAHADDCGRWIDTRQDMVNQWVAERGEWQAERKDLLDRIQAPSFAEYTNKVIKEKKAEQPQEEVKPIDFIS